MTIIAKPRHRLKTEYYVYFDDWTGEILSVGMSNRDDTPAPYIITNDIAAHKIVTGIESDAAYIVSSKSSHEQKLIHRDDYFSLLQQEENLFLVPESKPLEWDIGISLYTKNSQLVITANHKIIDKLVSYNHQIVEKDNQVHLKLYLIQKNNPDNMIKTVSVKLSELVNNGKVVVDISDVIASVDIYDISILTRRYFENYYFETVSEHFIHTDNTKTNKANYWQLVSSDGDAHMSLTQYGNTIEVKNDVSADQLSSIGMNSKYMSFYLVDDTPDQYIAKMAVDISKLRMGNIQRFNVDFDIMDVNIMYHHSRLKVKKRKQ